MSHTPGPWKAVDQTLCWEINDHAGLRIARVEVRPNITANAHLIAAAPRMFEALESIADGPCCQTLGRCVDEPMCDAMLARAAIAPLKGETE